MEGCGAGVVLALTHPTFPPPPFAKAHSLFARFSSRSTRGTTRRATPAPRREGSRNGKLGELRSPPAVPNDTSKRGWRLAAACLTSPPAQGAGVCNPSDLAEAAEMSSRMEARATPTVESTPGGAWERGQGGVAGMAAGGAGRGEAGRCPRRRVFRELAQTKDSADDDQSRDPGGVAGGSTLWWGHDVSGWCAGRGSAAAL